MHIGQCAGTNIGGEAQSAVQMPGLGRNSTLTKAPKTVTLRDIADANRDSSQWALVADMIEFDGPPVHQICGVPYVVLTQYGVKEEGASVYPDNETRCWTEAEAVWRFKRTMWNYLIAHPATQIAWRARPSIEQSVDGDYYVRCRFALLTNT